MLPRITIVTPSYNQAQFLEETIRSVLDQGYPSLEYMIVDGGSTDGSVDIIRKYESRLAWWVSEKDRGQPHAINKGLERATGDVFAFLNSDDVYTKGALARVGELFSEPGAALVCGKCRYIAADGTPGHDYPYHDPLDFATFVEHNGVPQPSVFVRLGVCREIGLFNEQMQYAFDYDYWFRMQIAGHAFRMVPETLSLYRLHASSKTVLTQRLLDWDIASVHERALRTGTTGPLDARSFRRAGARFCRRVAIEHYAWARDFAASLRFFRRMLALDPSVCDLKMLKVAIKAALRVPAPGPVASPAG